MQCTVSGNRMTIASNSPKQKAASNIQPVHRITWDGGSWGNISDSISIEPRDVKFISRIESDTELLTGEVIVQAPLRHQLIMRTDLSHTASFQHNDGMRLANCAEPVRNYDRRAAGH